ncbi:ImmA/IrrE family metallo-endopeptidase [Ruminococcus sp.]|uniref:ImmA/IrrE family metallo-endopeptidase n=1 Tax=Ruminococcus sp. TaxID=41978 RepID=UPI00261F5C40|nr:ImmA/IrrE family metallo-endopeptidase [Ruminococcus sp.]MDD6988792.1 ImmA/IrrE family metallo-endopeptidase [Ruminococcus sp.]
MDIKRELKKIKRKFKTLNPFEIAEKLDVVICDSILPDKLRGFFQISNRVIIIYLNNQLAELEYKMVFAHELAHALLHRGMNRIFMDSRFLNVPNRYENEANLLAAYMLISDDDIKEYIEHEYTTYQISQITGIKSDLVEKRINGYFEQK